MEGGDALDGVTGGGDFDFVGAEFLDQVDGASEGAVAFAVEAGGEGFDSALEDDRLRSGDLLQERQACWLDYTTETKW